MTLPSPAESRGSTILSIARSTLCRAFTREAPSPGDEPWLHLHAATFVTLTQEGELRGCIGSLEPYRPLLDDVSQNALAAAFRDPRFPPLAAVELDETDIEVSVLGERRPLAFADEQEAHALLRPGVDGVVLTLGRRRATFLPQVWEDLPDPADFLAHLLRKAGLSRDAWHAGLSLETYEVEKHAERPRGRRS